MVWGELSSWVPGCMIRLKERGFRFSSWRTGIRWISLYLIFVSMYSPCCFLHCSCTVHDGEPSLSVVDCYEYMVAIRPSFLLV